MPKHFYQLLEVDPGATLAEIRAAYTRVAAELGRKRRFITDNRGDPADVDLFRQATDEAWAVLSDPVLRRHYDALLVMSQSTEPVSGHRAAWKLAAGAMVHPKAGAAADLLRMTTVLRLGPLPPVPRPTSKVGTHLTPDEEATWVTREATPRTGVVHLPPPQAEAPSRVTIAPLPTPAPAPARGEDVGQLIERYGYSGILLRKVRENQGLHLEELSRRTRITVRFLEAFEQDDFSNLPSSATFLRSFLHTLGTELGLPPEALADTYLRRLQRD